MWESSFSMISLRSISLKLFCLGSRSLCLWFCWCSLLWRTTLVCLITIRCISRTPGLNSNLKQILTLNKWQVLMRQSKSSQRSLTFWKILKSIRNKEQSCLKELCLMGHLEQERLYLPKLLLERLVCHLSQYQLLSSFKNFKVWGPPGWETYSSKLGK